jgi:hypothetical protein
MEVKKRPLTFGKIERWLPIFDCDIPSPLKAAMDAPNSNNCCFEITFRGVPSKQGSYGRAGSCLREVRILSVGEP